MINIKKIVEIQLENDDDETTADNFFVIYTFRVANRV